MSDANRIPIDPDLERAMVELAPVASRMRQLEEDICVNGADEDYRLFHHKLVQHDDARAAIAGRAARLALRPGALLLFIEEFARLRRLSGRKPNLAQLQRAVMAAKEAKARDALERRAAEKAAAFRALRADRADADACDAIRYLEACRG